MKLRDYGCIILQATSCVQNAENIARLSLQISYLSVENDNYDEYEVQFPGRGVGEGMPLGGLLFIGIRNISHYVSERLKELVLTVATEAKQESWIL